MKILTQLVLWILVFTILGTTLAGCTTAPVETNPSTAPQQTTPSTTAPEETTPPTTAPAETEPPATEPEEPAMSPEEIYQQTEDPILTARRDTAEAYMRNMATFLWRAEENIVYAQNSTQTSEEELIGYQGTVIRYRAGQLYRGVPYTNSRSPGVNFFDYASEPDENGIHNISGLTGDALTSQIGNDCSGSIQQAWNYIGANIKSTYTYAMTPSAGYISVGEYKRDTSKPDSIDACHENSPQVMFAAYAQTKKADAVVRYYDNYNGHTMMVTDVNVVFKSNGAIDGSKSTVTFLHQTTTYIKNSMSYFDQELGERVYLTFGIDDVYTFDYLYERGYLPITCDVLTDPDAGRETFVHDSEKEHTFDNILKGTITTNLWLSNMTITITDQNGTVVTAAMRYAQSQRNNKNFTFTVEQRFPGPPFDAAWGELNLKDLAPGTYHCTHVLRDGHGTEYKLRDFDFTVS